MGIRTLALVSALSLAVWSPGDQAMAQCSGRGGEGGGPSSAAFGGAGGFQRGLGGGGRGAGGFAAGGNPQVFAMQMMALQRQNQMLQQQLQAMRRQMLTMQQQNQRLLARLGETPEDLPAANVAARQNMDARVTLVSRTAAAQRPDGAASDRAGIPQSSRRGKPAKRQ